MAQAERSTSNNTLNVTASCSHLYNGSQRCCEMSWGASLAEGQGAWRGEETSEGTRQELADPLAAPTPQPQGLDLLLSREYYCRVNIILPSRPRLFFPLKSP